MNNQISFVNLDETYGFEREINEALKENFKEFARKKHLRSKKNIALIGLGPHAKRIYLRYFKKYKVNLALLVEIDSKKDESRDYLKEYGFNNTKVFTIDDKTKDDELLDERIKSNLYAVCETLEITHIIIATEPKAHNMYLHFALEKGYHVLTDKPITVKKNMLNLTSINKVKKEYYDILALANKSDVMCNVMCQRNYHKGYEYIKKTLREVVKKFEIPITYIDIYHSDGAWEMPHDMLKENHPYKYGYGKLFHSGYHFIDFLSEIMKINNYLDGTKKIEKAYLYSSCLTPNDELNVFNKEDYIRIFKEENLPEYYKQDPLPKFNKFGEKNFYGTIDFKNRNNQLITRCNLNLLHYGFSRRGWMETRDFYKENGRVRHEYINIQVGPLMNIKVHSYQSKQISERKSLKEEELSGGLEHFDIEIYRNSDVIGGKPYELIKLGDLYSEKEKKDILGYNELARDTFLNNFLKGTCTKGDIKDQALSIEILTACAKGIFNYNHNKRIPVSIEVRNGYTYKLDLETYKKYSDGFRNLKKRVIDSKKIFKDDYEISIYIDKVIKDESYLTFISISDNEKIAGGLLSKKTNNKNYAKLRFFLLRLILKHLSVDTIFKLIEKRKKQK